MLLKVGKTIKLSVPELGQISVVVLENDDIGFTVNYDNQIYAISWEQVERSEIVIVDEDRNLFKEAA